ncbi:putative signal transduction histidine-protein kinase [Podospora fimiseda]|uniref:histidine kinase n=1 Tax=Podospora fimiseda TaxID=252190 RepID=A0AAN7BS63_9PEZI|nr:putative signal transduction histidine-protein kinase [Podospora fimiseda]
MHKKGSKFKKSRKARKRSTSESTSLSSSSSSSTSSTNISDPDDTDNDLLSFSLTDQEQQMPADLGGSRGSQTSRLSDTAPQPSGKKSLAFKEQLEKDGQPSSGRFAEVEPEVESGNAQRQLNEYRENLARHIETRDAPGRAVPLPIHDRIRVSPILEEASPPQVTSGSAPTTASTESGNTVRGMPTPSMSISTPSYPFPRMTPPSAFIPSAIHRPFTTLSPTNPPAGPGVQSTFDAFRGHDSVLSNPSTPASTLTFLPPGASHPSAEQFEFPSPNLYELALMLSAEPGLDAWWNTVVQIMVDVYRAERVTLAVPADSTDIENVPWGQKATFNARREDDLSLGYLARGSSFMPGSNTDEFSEEFSQTGDSTRLQEPVRPGLMNRHSFTSFEDKKGGRPAGIERTPPNPRRPNMPSRSKTSHGTTTLLGHDLGDESDDNRAELNQRALEEHDALEEQQNIPSWEAPFTAPREGHGKVLNVLQALDYEADPLIDHNGVMRVLDRGKVVALTRNYPYLGQAAMDQQTTTDPRTPANRPKSPGESRRRSRRQRSDSTSKLSSLLGSATSLTPASSRTGKGQVDKTEDKKSTSRRYEEYEQTPPSPWSQSPAPSPAIRPEPNENPFFTDAMVDEDSFNPSTAAPDYSTIGPPEAIGVDNSWTVLHIPLTHVLLSKPNPAFKLDPSLMEQKIFARAKLGDTSTIHCSSPERPFKEKHAPIAILSILSPFIPYPSSLRHSLEHLAPHLATSFSMCRHYTNLEIELSGLQKRRPQTAGFGAIGPDGRPLADPTALASMAYAIEEAASRSSMAGSITSPSDYSGPSRSTAGSPGTPGWDPAARGFLAEKRGPVASPLPVAADSYFGSVPRSGPGSSGHRTRRNSKETERKSSLRVSGTKMQSQESVVFSPDVEEIQSNDFARRDSDEARRTTAKPESSIDEMSVSVSADKKGTAAPGATHKHTQLHTYGADFASTFQSLPPSSTIGKGVPSVQLPSRTGSLSQPQHEMTPPSDKLKGLILDSLPAHVFVALPQTGEIVWVNSRFLSYRGQTSGDLASDPWGSIHPDDREEYLRSWSLSVRTGEQFSRTVRIRRFDGAYRWFYARAVASKDKRGVIMQFLGSYMDIHDQHIAELRAARQEEIEASEAKHRLLANLIPQIIFTATEDEGITFANEQWLSYTGQSFDDVLGLGFMDFVHPDDLAKCQIPGDGTHSPVAKSELKGHGHSASVDRTSSLGGAEINIRGIHQALSRNNSSSTSSVYDLPTANLTALAKKGVIRVSTDSSGRLSYTTEIRLRSKSGEYRWHLIRCVEIDNVDFGNGASSYFGSATDINDLKLLETKLKEAMDSKGRFLSNMSHEIRTPLIGISGMVSFLQDTTLNEEQRDYTNTIQTSANSLLMIINDILDLSKVDAGMMKLNFEWFHTRSLIEDVNELVSTMAIAKRLELNYVVEEDVPAWVNGDKVRIRQVLLNVIGNAIKFTNQGEVFSRCKVIVPDHEISPDEIMLEFSIIDTGRGFSKEEAELIFKPFSQIDGSSTRQHGGSGLGLVISRQLAELHGGKMEGTAELGKGSTFTFTAKFGLPTEFDHPDGASIPQPTPGLMRDVRLSEPHSPYSLRSIQTVQSMSPAQMDQGHRSPGMASSGSSELSANSNRTHMTERTSMSSVSGLGRFSEAARASGQDLSQMKLEMPSRRGSPDANPTPINIGDTKDNHLGVNVHHSPPPMYSILIICPQTHSREATTKHIEMTLPKNIPHNIAAVASVDEARALVTDHNVNFTHIVINLRTPEEIISLMDKIMLLSAQPTVLILSDSVQRQAVLKQASGTKYESILTSETRVTYIYKPVKPSRFAVIFDPANERDLSIDRNRSTAQRLVDSQRQSYIDMEKRMGGKGYKVLLVEDNPVNQKVLQKYLNRVGLEVELAGDGEECMQIIKKRGWGWFALVLCDLHMPRKDGYQACREIRQWEAEELERLKKKEGKEGKKLPIIALSANVMSDVQEKCIEAGFNDYVTKPVDFIDLSAALSKFF